MYTGIIKFAMLTDVPENWDFYFDLQNLFISTNLDDKKYQNIKKICKI